jgi:hypothetical protein
VLALFLSEEWIDDKYASSSTFREMSSIAGHQGTFINLSIYSPNSTMSSKPMSPDLSFPFPNSTIGIILAALLDILFDRV